MSSDAYAPPEARLTDARSTPGKVYSLNQITVATLLGSPIAGCWLMRQNYGVFQDERGRRQVLLWGALGSLAVIGASLLLPDSLPSSLLPIAYTIGLRETAKRQQGSQVADHLAAGQPKHSWWRVVGISILCSILFVAAATPIVLLVKGLPPPR